MTREEISEAIAKPNAAFDAWKASIETTVWARFDLSAAKLGFEAGQEQAEAQNAALEDEVATWKSEACYEVAGAPHLWSERAKAAERKLYDAGREDWNFGATSPTAQQGVPSHHELRTRLDAAEVDRDKWAAEAEYRANSCSLLAAENKRLREALTPSGATKNAYMGEFYFKIDDLDEDGNERRREVMVPWTTIKEIMNAIENRALENSHD